MKKSLILLPIAAAMFSMSLSTQGAEYHVVVPTPGKAAPYASIKLELNPASLPVGVVGDSYVGFDFNSALRITGDSDLDMGQVSWSRYSGELPEGLALSRDGSVYGIPTIEKESSFQVLAKYKTKTAVSTYSLTVNDISLRVSGALPSIVQRESFNYSIASWLSVSGDPAYQTATESWSIVNGELPAGLSLSDNGVISGAPTEFGVFPVSIAASYKGRGAQLDTELNVQKVEINIEQAQGVRRWEDGTVAQSCKGYRQSTWPYVVGPE